MPGTMTGVVTGFIERQKGRGLVENSALQRVGKGGMLAAGGGNAYVNLTTAGNGADTTEDTLFTVNLPANTLDVVGRSIWIQAFGNITNAAVTTKTAKVYFGTSITTSTSLGTGVGGNWSIFIEVYKSGSNTQTAMSQIDNSGATTFRTISVVTNGSETDTAAITIKVTGQSTTGTANIVTCNGLIVSGFN